MTIASEKSQCIQGMISVITRVYNRIAFLPEALQSVLDQSYETWEVLIIDDGSEKEHGEKIRQHISLLKAQGRSMHYVYIPHSDRSTAFNCGLKDAKGEFIVILDDDDLFAPDFMRKLVQPLLDGADISACWTDFFNSNDRGQIIKVLTPKQEALELKNLLIGNYSPTCSLMFRRKILEQVGGMDQNILACEDWDLLLRLAALFPKHVLVPEILSHVRVHPGNTSHQELLMKDYQSRVIIKADSYLSKRQKKETNYSFAVTVLLTISGWYEIVDGQKNSGRQKLLRTISFFPFALIIILPLTIVSLLPASLLRTMTYLLEDLCGKANVHRLRVK